MKSLVLLSLLSLAAARPGGIISPWGGSYSVVPQPYVHAPVVIAKPAATSYASFQQYVSPVAVAQPALVHAPVVSQPIVQAVAAPVYHAPPVYHAAPVVHAVPQPVLQKYVSVSGYGHSW